MRISDWSSDVCSSDLSRFFAGRQDTLARIIAALEGEGAHVVIYGERGIGKTSLMHVLADTARAARYMVVYDSCGADTRFDTMFRSILSRIPQIGRASCRERVCQYV